MKTLDEIVNNYEEWSVFLDDRFGVRLAQFLTQEQLEKQVLSGIVMNLILNPKSGLERIFFPNLKKMQSSDLKKPLTREVFLQV